jgi:hypothetical protein
VNRFVGKGNSQNMAVSIVFGCYQDNFQVFFDECVSFSRTSRCVIYGERWSLHFDVFLGKIDFKPDKSFEEI